MTDDVQFAPLEASASAAAHPGGPTVDLERLTDVTVEVAVQIGRTRMTLGGALALGPGAIVTLDRAADQPVDLLVNGKTIARGEVVVVDESFGLRITEVVGAAPRAEAQPPALAAAPPIGELPAAA